MSKIEDGGPAFPNNSDEQFYTPGMSLRDWFAGQALAGLLGDPSRGGSFKLFACEAYEAADAMLAARKTGSGE